MSVELEQVLMGRVLAAWEASEEGRLFRCEGVPPSLLAKVGHAACRFVELDSAVRDLSATGGGSAAVEILESMLVSMWTQGFRVGMAHQADLGAADLRA